MSNKKKFICFVDMYYLYDTTPSTLIINLFAESCYNAEHKILENSVYDEINHRFTIKSVIAFDCSDIESIKTDTFVGLITSPKARTMSYIDFCRDAESINAHVTEQNEKANEKVKIEKEIARLQARLTELTA